MKKQKDGAAAIAPWFRLHLPYCSLGFDSQSHHLHFFQDENKQKGARIGPFFKKETES